MAPVVVVVGVVRVVWAVVDFGGEEGAGVAACGFVNEVRTAQSERVRCWRTRTEHDWQFRSTAHTAQLLPNSPKVPDTP